MRYGATIRAHRAFGIAGMVLALGVLAGVFFYPWERASEPALPEAQPASVREAVTEPEGPTAAEPDLPTVAFDFDAPALEDLTAAQRSRLIKTKSRWVLPTKDFEQKDDRQLVYLQFEDWPSNAEKRALAEQGVELGASQKRHAYRALLDPGAWDRIKNRSGIVGAAPVGRRDKMSPGLREKLGEDPDATVSVSVRVARGLGWSASEFLKDQGVDGAGDLAGGEMAVVRTTAGEVDRLAKLDEVVTVLGYKRPSFILMSDESWGGKATGLEGGAEGGVATGESGVMSAGDLPIEPMNDENQQVHNVDDLQAAPYGLSGQNVVICEIDGGQVLANHEILTGRVTNHEDEYELELDYARHATHVAGTMIGDDTGGAQYEGMAPAATLHAYDFEGAPLESDPAYKLQEAVTAHDAVTNNNSWGRGIGAGVNEEYFGAYTQESYVWDGVIYDNDVVVCFSSANDRNDAGLGGPPDEWDHDGTEYPGIGIVNPYLDCATDHASAKNVITVGALNEVGDTISNFSSTGPTNDGRIKPDVVAVGVSVESSVDDGVDQYDSMDGTSMASPTTTGITALLIEYHKNELGGVPSAALVKGLLVETAVDLGTATGPGFVGPDPIYGYGRVDAQAAVDLMAAQAVDGHYQIHEGAVSNGGSEDFYVLVSAAGTDLKITLCWLDPQGNPVDPSTDGTPGDGDVNDGLDDPVLINDLDVVLTAPDGTKHYAYSLDPDNPDQPATNTSRNTVDTVEQVVVSNADTGVWRVDVRGTSVPESAPQAYAVLCDEQHPMVPEVPILDSPSGEILETSPRFRWDMPSDSDPGGDVYHIQVYDTTDGVMVIDRDNLTSTAWTSNPALQVNHCYRWRVRARTDAVGDQDWGEWSGWTNFCIVPYTKPGGCRTYPEPRPRFRWTTPARGSPRPKYEVRVWERRGGRWVVIWRGYTWGQVIRVPKKLEKRFRRFRRYRWAVRAFRGGNYSNWSNITYRMRWRHHTMWRGGGGYVVRFFSRAQRDAWRGYRYSHRAYRYSVWSRNYYLGLYRTMQDDEINYTDEQRADALEAYRMFNRARWRAWRARRFSLLTRRYALLAYRQMRRGRMGGVRRYTRLAIRYSHLALWEAQEAEAEARQGYVKGRQVAYYRHAYRAWRFSRLGRIYANRADYYLARGVR